jgi:hypothetical protein
MQVQIVNTGIDTVKVNVKLLTEDGQPAKPQQVSGLLADWLPFWQEQAKETMKPVKTALTFHDARLMMYPNGAAAWKYILRNDCLEIKVVPRLTLPMVAKVTFQSEYLWHMGRVEEAIEEATVFLREMFEADLLLQAAQLDMCVDLLHFALPSEWEQVFISHALTKRSIVESQKDQAFHKGRKLETILFSGHGRPVSCKLYNKSLEIQQHGGQKAWFYPGWREHGWDGESPVWRVEYSVEREGFNEMNIDTIDDALRNVKRLWQYCTYDWLRMVTPGRSRNRTRWATDDNWKRIQHAFDDYGDKALDGLGPLVREKKREVNQERAIAAIAGWITTYGAWTPEDRNTETCAEDLFSEVHQKTLERWQKLQTTPQDLIREKQFLYHQKG